MLTLPTKSLYLELIRAVIVDVVRALQRWDGVRVAVLGTLDSEAGSVRLCSH